MWCCGGRLYRSCVSLDLECTRLCEREQWGTVRLQFTREKVFMCGDGMLVGTSVSVEDGRRAVAYSTLQDSEQLTLRLRLAVLFMPLVLGDRAVCGAISCLGLLSLIEMVLGVGVRRMRFEIAVLHDDIYHVR